jgi:hypothetical protein
MMPSYDLFPISLEVPTAIYFYYFMVDARGATGWPHPGLWDHPTRTTSDRLTYMNRP